MTDQPLRSDENPNAALLSALVTEHFVQQAVRSTITSEAISRASVYLAALSSAMIALGFVSNRPATLSAFLAAVLPVVLLLGLTTFKRLVDLGVQDLRRLQDIERIKDYYRTLGPQAEHYFPPVQWQDPRALVSSQNLHAGPLQLFSTAAATVALINSAVVGIAASLAVSTTLPAAVAVPLGVLAASSAMGLCLRHQWTVNVRAFKLPAPTS